MPLPRPESGLVICYAYLWHAELQVGHEEGLKDRPCVIVLAPEGNNDEIVVTVLPITHRPPSVAAAAIEIPQSTKTRLGLDGERSWVVLTEMNRFPWPGPDLRPISRTQPDRFAYGLLPPAFFDQIIARLRGLLKAGEIPIAKRTS
jgi:hypothetical protein